MRPAVQSLLLAALIAAAGAWVWHARSSAPDVASVNGVYTSDCCGDLTLHDGVMAAGGARVSFKLERMKFGLTAYPAERLEVRGNRVVVLPGTGEALSFGEAGNALTVCADRLCNKTSVFRRRT